MPPKKILETKATAYKGKPLRYRTNHFIAKFENQDAASDEARQFLEVVIGPSPFGLVDSVGRWGYFWLDPRTEDLPEGDQSVEIRRENFLFDLIDRLDTALDPGGFAEPDLVFVAAYHPNDKYMDETNDDFQWALMNTNIMSSWDIQTGSGGVLMVHLDSGVPLKDVPLPFEVDSPPQALDGYLAHEDLDGSRFIAGMDPVKGERWPNDDSGNYHGTGIAGIMAATTDDGKGMAGINWGSSVFVFKASHSAGTTTYSTAGLIYLGIAEAINYASSLVPEPRLVINFSKEFDDDTDSEEFPDGTIKAIFGEIKRTNSIVCIAAGNGGGEVTQPAATGIDPANGYDDHVLVVGAIGPDDAIYVNSCRGQEEMVYAPGLNVISTYKTSGLELHKLVHGTSFATPHVTALVANLWSEYPELPAARLVKLLKSTCREPATAEAIATYGGGAKFGRGIIDAWAALTALKPRICLVLDRSGSMKESAGIGTMTRLEILKAGASHLVDLADPGSSLGVVAFNAEATTIFSLEEIVDLPETPPGTPEVPGVRDTIKDQIGGLEPGGSTSIGAGVEAARKNDMLGSASNPRAIIVVTDGKENHEPYLASLAAAAEDINVYAVGMGTPEELEPSGLKTLATSTGGYMVLLEELVEMGSNAVSKFLAQIVTEISGYEQVVDPSFRLRGGETERVEFVLGSYDTTAEIVLLTPSGAPLEVTISSPPGLVEGALPVRVTRHGGVSRHRFEVPRTREADEASGRSPWSVTVSTAGHEFEAWLGELARTDREASTYANLGIPVTLLVTAKSRLKMKGRVEQSSFRPGADMTLRVDLEADGTALAPTSDLRVKITDPTGDTVKSPAPKIDGGQAVFTIRADRPGTYRWLVKGRSAEDGSPVYQREIQLTGSVWEDASATGVGPPSVTTKHRPDDPEKGG